MILSYQSQSPEDTRALGELIGLLAQGPLALLLAGEYGSGKTTFAQGLATGLGIDGIVRSPSYNIVRRYTEGRLLFVHADLYRAGSLAEVEELGLEELAGPTGIIAVEWPGDFGIAFGDLTCIDLRFTYSSEDSEQRSITICCPEDCPAALLEGLLAAAA